MTLGVIFFLAGFSLGVRWLILFYYFGTQRTHVPSLILASILLIFGLLMGIIAIIADLIAVNRKILEENQYRIRKLESLIDQDKNFK